MAEREQRTAVDVEHLALVVEIRVHERPRPAETRRGYQYAHVELTGIEAETVELIDLIKLKADLHAEATKYLRATQ